MSIDEADDWLDRLAAALHLDEYRDLALVVAFDQGLLHEAWRRTSSHLAMHHILCACNDPSTVMKIWLPYDLRQVQQPDDLTVAGFVRDRVPELPPYVRLLFYPSPEPPP